MATTKLRAVSRSGPDRRSKGRRRPGRWWGVCVAVTALAIGFGFPAPAAELARTGGTAAAASRPDIVWIVVDDARLDALQHLPRVRSLLTARGLLFTNATVTNPLCCPSRSSMLTGRYSHNTGVWLNEPPRGGFRAFPDQHTVATTLDAAGYRPALIGKYLNSYDRPAYVPPGWDEWAAFVHHEFFNYSLAVNGTLKRYGAAPGEYSTDELTRRAVSFIRATPPADRLFLYLAPLAPHQPATPAPRDATTPASLPPHRPPSYSQADVSDKPRWVRAKAPLGGPAADAIDATRLNMVRSLGAVDDMVAAVVGALAAGGRLGTTMIAFTSDNGHHWGEHRLREKGTPYEEAIRVPLVIRYDPLTRSAGTSARLVQNVDLAPTAAALAGRSLASPVDGRSMLPLLSGPPTSWRSWALLEHLGGSVPSFCGLRTRGWKYVRYPGTGEQELYDLARDPFELTNLAGRAEHAQRQRQFRALVDGSCRVPPRSSPPLGSDTA